MSKAKEQEKLKPAKELYCPHLEAPARPGADQHKLYKSTGYRVEQKNSSCPGKWSPYPLRITT